MALLGEVQTLQFKNAGAGYSSAGSCLCTEAKNKCKQRELCVSQCKQLLSPHSFEKLFRNNKPEAVLLR